MERHEQEKCRNGKAEMSNKSKRNGKAWNRIEMESKRSDLTRAAMEKT